MYRSRSECSSGPFGTVGRPHGLAGGAGAGEVTVGRVKAGVTGSGVECDGDGDAIQLTSRAKRMNAQSSVHTGTRRPPAGRAGRRTCGTTKPPCVWNPQVGAGRPTAAAAGVI